MPAAQTKRARVLASVPPEQPTAAPISARATQPVPLRGEWDLDTLVPSLGLTPRDFATRIPREATLDYAWEVVVPATGRAASASRLDLSIATGRAAFEREVMGTLELEARLTLRGLGGSERTLPAWIAQAGDRTPPRLSAFFDDSKLACAIGFAKCEGDVDARPFLVEAFLIDGQWRGGVYLLHRADRCQLLRFPSPPLDPCADHSGLMSLVGASPHRVSLKWIPEVSVTPEAMLQQVQNVRSLEADWAVGERTIIHVRAEQRGDACLSQGMDRDGEPSDVIRHEPPQRMDSVVVPVALHVRSEDKRLDATLWGYMSAHTVHGKKWDGSMELYASRPVDQIEQYGGASIYASPPGTLSTLSLRLSFVNGERLFSQLDFRTYTRRTEAPLLPSEGELGFNNLSCFVDTGTVVSREVTLQVR